MNKKLDPQTLESRLAAAGGEPVRLVEDAETGDRVLIYATDGGANVEFRFRDKALWMTQEQISLLFGRERSVITKHINNVFSDGELDEESNVQKMHITRPGRPVTIYSLDTIISVGYRVSSKQATLFRKWATATLVRFATKGFVVDVQRLKDPGAQDHIDELREIIRDIRASEANVYREVRTLCSLCQDYDASTRQARDFFAMMQNKMLYSVASMTAPEIVRDRADAAQPNMGLQTWPRQAIRKADVTVAHNYLGEAEIEEKNRLTVMLLDFFEDRLKMNRLTTMAEAAAQLDDFLKFNMRPILVGKGPVSRSDADRAAHAQYAIFDTERRRLRHEST